MITPADKYGKLTVIGLVKKDKYYNKWFLVLCDCGKEKVVFGPHLTRKNGAIKSCGCTRTHGMTHSKTYNSWSAMLSRVRGYQPHYVKNYVNRGIVVCDRWKSFENFLADMGERPNGTSLDRIDNEGNYEPGNCRWATPKQQYDNRREQHDDRWDIAVDMRESGASLWDIANTLGYKSPTTVMKIVAKWKESNNANK